MESPQIIISQGRYNELLEYEKAKDLKYTTAVFQCGEMFGETYFKVITDNEAHEVLMKEIEYYKNQLSELRYQKAKPVKRKKWYDFFW